MDSKHFGWMDDVSCFAKNQKNNRNQTQGEEHMIEAFGYMLIGVFFALLIPFLKALAETKIEDKKNDAAN